MTLTETRAVAEPKSRQRQNDVHPLTDVIKEARRRHRRRMARTAMVSLSVILMAAAGLLVAESGGGSRTPSPPTGGVSGRSHAPSLANASAHPGFVLLPTWLPPGFSASGGGWVEPVGGLSIGGGVGEIATVGPSGTAAKPRQNPVLFSLSYYGYHDPESKNIRLTAFRLGSPPQGSLETLGGRHVQLSSAYQPGYYGGNTNSSASWAEHGAYIEVMAQGITKTQLAQFVAGLKEHRPPKSS
jgi:hypothetical protein